MLVDYLPFIAMLLALGPLLAFFGTGHFTGFGIIASELFPTSFRGLAMGLTYNFGRAISALPIASICCSPPERVPADWPLRSWRRGKSL